MSGIYCITNKINEKIYIGSTRDFEIRWQRHYAPNSKCVKLRNSIQKHGIENFQMEVLEQIDIAGMSREDSHKLLLEREQEHLDTLQPFDETGYNIQRKANGSYGTPHTKEYIESVTGGNGPCAKSVIKYDKKGNAIYEYGSIQEAAKNNHPASVKRIVECCTERAITTGGFMWAYKGDPAPIPRVQQRYTRPVKQLCTVTGNLLNTFQSLREAANLTSCFPGGIGDVCKNKYGCKTAGGYRWEYAT